jgi:hypothetical protein
LPGCRDASEAAVIGCKIDLARSAPRSPGFRFVALREVEYRYGCLWSEVDDLLDLDPSRKDLVHPDWACVLERIGRDL